MSYEDDGGDGDDEGGRGKLVPVASYLTVHEAELARTRLVAEGLLAFVWDGATVNADPLLAVALRGVKVAVPERDAPRARRILATLAGPAADGRHRPAFRVRGTHETSGLLLGLLGGVGLAAGMSAAEDGPLPWLALPAGAVVGRMIGAARRADVCSACRHPLPSLERDACPRCAAPLRGEIAHLDDRLAAEEALGGDGADDPRDDLDPDARP